MNKKITTSVVMATYNGEKYVLNQLESLKNQTKCIDEVLIYDDCSKDQTVSLIKKFIEDNHLDNWNITVNEVNYGWRVNFMKLLDAASGEIIFTCDQDDIWMPDKIELMSTTFSKNPNISVLVSDYIEIIENTGSSSKLRKLKTVEDNGVKKVIFNSENLLLKRPGCVFAIKKEFVPKVEEYYRNAENSAHDLAMWGAAIIYDQLYYLQRPMIHFRRHETSSFQQEVSLSKKQNSIYEGRINALKRFNVRLDSAKEFMKNQKNIKNHLEKEKIINEMEHENLMRISNLEKKSMTKVVKNYRKYINKFNLMADLYHITKAKRS